MSDQLFVYPGKIVLYRPTASDVIGSNHPQANEDAVYPLIISSIKYKTDDNGDHTEPGYDSVTGVAIIEGRPVVVENVPPGDVQGTFTDVVFYHEPEVTEPRGVVSIQSTGRGAPVVPANTQISGLEADIASRGGIPTATAGDPNDPTHPNNATASDSAGDL